MKCIRCGIDEPIVHEWHSARGVDWPSPPVKIDLIGHKCNDACGPQHESHDACIEAMRAIIESMGADNQRLRETLHLYADQKAWTSFTDDAGLNWSFDWDGDLGDEPWE